MRRNMTDRAFRNSPLYERYLHLMAMTEYRIGETSELIHLHEKNRDLENVIVGLKKEIEELSRGILESTTNPYANRMRLLEQKIIWLEEENKRLQKQKKNI